ncbi:MAG: methionine--tRNA ligase [Bacilli bacterium]|jgi:methionyl-tRNA synthetase|nr:methionine--tRNA ligase [Bacilli bacterium]
MEEQKKKYFYITTPIYYASGNIHIGHTYCCTCADVIARYKRLRGYSVRFMTGSDEHGQKIQGKAIAAGMTPQAYVDKIAQSFKDVWKAMNISYDYYVRTTDDYHVACVKKVFTQLLKKGDIYLGKYQGWYCTYCESFFTEEQVGPDHLCPDCHRPVHFETEDAYFLNVKKFVPDLLKFYETHPDFCQKDKINEMVNTFIKPGLEDLCITRTSFDWGIPIDENPKHVVYVWIDALLNYISALGYLSNDDTLMKEYWSDDSEIIHLVGRDITRFHTIYWPILLMALGLRQPDKVIVHGLLLTRSGVKLSKSLGNAPSPYPLIERYGVDSLRYYLVREIQFESDGAFTPLQFIDRLNADLANNYGNLVNRTLSMVKRYFNGVIPEADLSQPQSELTKKLFEDATAKLTSYEGYMDSLDITGGTGAAMEMLDLGNKYFDAIAPWTQAKNGNTALLKESLAAASELLRMGGILLTPVMPMKTKEALDQEAVPEALRTYDSVQDHGKLAGITVGELAPLFPRLKKDDELVFLTNLIDGPVTK